MLYLTSKIFRHVNFEISYCSWKTSLRLLLLVFIKKDPLHHRNSSVCITGPYLKTLAWVAATFTRDVNSTPWLSVLSLTPDSLAVYPQRDLPWIIPSSFSEHSAVVITDSKIDKLRLLMFRLDQLIPSVLMMVFIRLKSLWCLECSIPAFDLCTETCNFTPHCLSVGARKIIIVSLLLIMTSILLIASLVTWENNTAFL